MLCRHILRRTTIAVLTVYLIITISFILVHVMPGDPVIHLVGQEEYYYLLDNDPVYLERQIERYGLNESLPVQYIKYLKSIATLDFGTAYANQKPVTENVLKASGWTLMLSVPTWLLGGLMGAVLGVLAGWKPGKRFDKIMTPFFLVINTIPANCLSLIFLMFFPTD